MKTLGSFINKKTLDRRTYIDEKSVLYVFEAIIKEEYGKQGVENIKPMFFKDKKIFIKVSGSTWPNEILLARKRIVAQVNRELGGEEIIDLAMSN